MEQLFYFPARVVGGQNPLAGLFPSKAELTARYRDRLPDSPAEQPYFLKTEISNNSLDHYFTHMLTTSLQNYAADADDGVSLQDSHNTFRLGYGRSLFGRYDTEPGTPPGWDRPPRRGSAEYTFAIPQPAQYERVLSAAFIIPGIKLNNLSFASTDDFIQAVETGMVEEVSIGYGGGAETCDVCGARYFSWECMHVAGFTYDIERAGQAATIMATVSINNAHLFEYSAVYAGATPNAVVVRKAEQEAEAGRLTRKQAAAIEARYRVRLPMPPENWRGANVTPNLADERTTNMDELDQIRALASEAGAPEGPVVEAVRWLVGENARLAPLADEGRQYREDLVADALAEGVRAMGEAFPAETYRQMFARAGLEEIKLLRTKWQEQAAQRFPGERQTVDEQSTKRQATPAIVPDSAYKS
jgi:hypothetical protein